MDRGSPVQRCAGLSTMTCSCGKKLRLVLKRTSQGGIQGGISNGMEVFFRVAFKPVATLDERSAEFESERREGNCEGKRKARSLRCATSRSYRRSHGSYDAC